MDQLTLFDLPPAAPRRRPRRPRLRAEVLRGALQAVAQARRLGGHGLQADELEALATWLQRSAEWSATTIRPYPRPRTSRVVAWRLVRLAEWAKRQDLYLEGATAGELQAWALRLGEWAEGRRNGGEV